MRYESIISYGNLMLAWRRITTGLNLPYKRFYRPLIAAYELGLADNLKYLRERLRGGWSPMPPVKMFQPKASGLQRPISLLTLEDQIVLQAVANRVERKLRHRRQRVEYRIAFSNCVSERAADSIFFVDRWQRSYRRFQEAVTRSFEKGQRWVAYFDFAAFYDTISHERLMATIAPRSGTNDVWMRVKRWLKTWSATAGAVPLEQGIPQGPLASNFLAEVFLLPLDEAMLKTGFGYLRYVDDVRMFAREESEVRRAAIAFEIECRHLGLIPQAKKYGVSRVTSLREALGALPSIPARGAGEPALDARTAYRRFMGSISGRPQRITDKSRARFVLYHAPSSRKLLRKVIRLLPHHPEHIDAFSAYFSGFQRSKPLERALKDLLKEGTPYPYVRGELWKVLTRIGSSASFSEMAPLAREDLRRYRQCSMLQWGALAFLLRCQKKGLCRASRRMLHQNPLVQSLLVAALPESEYSRSGVVAALLRVKAYEPGIVLADELIERQLDLRTCGITASQLSVQVQNVFKSVGLIGRRTRTTYDQVGRILANRYGIPSWAKWRAVLGPKYLHALQILIVADSAFDIAPSTWLQHQDSFSDALLRCVLDHLTRLGMPGEMSTINRRDELVPYGVLLDPNHRFGQNHPPLANDLRLTHKRRNALPGSHPYETRSGQKTRYLRSREKLSARAQFSRAYARIITLLDPVL